ncbi:h domain protein [Nocardia sp. NBC_01503]|uniref:h domain protein n=1 Tax=Nocardia sp. NBC_01503 TaxID=2975997 RepID=UPI002E7B7DD0|nr:h domain protein [Nocardia sp. NBC_01503]WTL34235.1 h domain protein [Nocardia sp. NBC_01503]
MKFNKRTILVASAVILFVAAVAAASFTGFRYWSDVQSESARTDAVAAAQHTVETMSSYQYETVDKEMPKAADNMTGDLRDTYLKLIQQTVIPTAKEKKINVQATVQASGVISTDRDHAAVLIFMNQVTTSDSLPQGTITSSRLRVELTKDGSHWLATAVTPV